MTFLNLSINPFYISLIISSSFFFCVIYIKMSQSLSAKYYQENKERLHKTWERYQNLSKEENHKLVEYRKKY